MGSDGTRAWTAGRFGGVAAASPEARADGGPWVPGARGSDPPSLVLCRFLTRPPLRSPRPARCWPGARGGPSPVVPEKGVEPGQVPRSQARTACEKHTR